MGGLSVALLERENQRLNPLIEKENIDQLRSSKNKLESLIQNENLNAEDLNSELIKIAKALNTFGEARGSQIVREDSDSLSKVIYRLKQAYEDTRALRGAVSGKEQDIQQTIKLINILGESVDLAGRYIIKKRQKFQEFSGR